MKTTTLFFSLIICLFSCSNDDDDNNPIFQPTEIAFTQIARGSLYGDGSENIPETNIIINNETDWQNLIAQMNTVFNQSNNFSETSIDFTNFTVVSVFLDIKPTGWGVFVTSMIENETTITVTTDEIQYDSQSITQPYYIAKIAKTNKEFVFISE